MKSGRHMGGKPMMARKDGGAMIDKGREEDEEKQEMEGHKKGGRVKRKDGGALHFAEGGMAAARHDRPGRKRGGAVGADKRPLTSANSTKNAEGMGEGVDETTAS